MLGNVVRLSEAEPFVLVQGISGRAIFGERSMVSVVEFDPDAAAQLHSHPQEQVGVVTRGEQVLVIDGSTYRLVEGDAYFIPGGVPHSAVAGPEGCTCIEAFQPIRQDYVQFAEGREVVPFS